MNICIAYDSKYGNGKKCVDHLKKIIRAKGHNVNTYSVRETKPDKLPATDFYIFSTPTHIGGPPRKMKKFIKNLEPKQSGAKYSVIVTHMDPNAKTVEKMEALVKPKGLTRATEGLMIKVGGMKGPLEEGYEHKLELFAAKILGTK